MEAEAEAVNAAAWSPCGTYLICGTSLGRLHVWLFSEGTDGIVPPSRVVTLTVHNCAIYTLTFADTSAKALLLSGADEEICGWHWDALLAAARNGSAPPAAVLRFENGRAALRRGAMGQLSETSAISYDATTKRLYSAAGDGNAYAWDLAAQTCVATFAGAGEPLHCLAMCERRQQLVTGGEDGGVRLWDVRAAKCSQTLRPDAPPLVASASPVGSGGSGSGGWCGCLAVDSEETWLVAGWGDGFLCSIDLNTLSSVACMPTAAAPTAVSFEPGSDFHLVSTGAESGVYHWRLTGELSHIPTFEGATMIGAAPPLLVLPILPCPTLSVLYRVPTHHSPSCRPYPAPAPNHWHWHRHRWPTGTGAGGRLALPPPAPLS